MTSPPKPAPFWSDAVALKGAATPSVMVHAAIFTLLSLVVTAIHFNKALPNLNVDVTPFEVGGAVLGAILVLRTNAGYERWWEGRKLWGGIVNQSRNLGVSAVAYGPGDAAWRDRFVRWSAAFGHASRLSLRGRRESPELVTLLGPEDAARVLSAHHMPSFVLDVLARLLREARDSGLDAFAFLEMERQRAILMDHIGGCERILKSPLPRAYAIQIRRFLAVFLATLPFGLVERIAWLTPIATFLVAYPLFALDDIGVELQFPFSERSLNHLPLDEICSTIERDLLAMIGADGSPKA